MGMVVMGLAASYALLLNGHSLRKRFSNQGISGTRHEGSTGREISPDA